MPKKQDQRDKLIGMIHRMVEILRYDNTHAFDLLKNATLNKRAVIELDGYRLSLKSSQKRQGELVVDIKKARAGDEISFSTDSLTLKQIMAGAITLDYAVVMNKLYVKAPFYDLLNIYRLTITLLAEGPLNKHLRKLWREFELDWHENGTPRPIMPLEQQKPANAYLLEKIPETVLLSKMPF